MRIISGKNRGKKIKAPENLPVRPTTDAAKESLFNILGNHFTFQEIRVLDLFSGTGNIAYEFASRGCNDVTAVDLDPGCIRFISNTVENLMYDAILAIQADFAAFLSRNLPPWDLIFADPPYNMDNIEEIPEKVRSGNVLNERGWLVLEHDKFHDFSEFPGFFDHRRYGKVHFSFFERS